jgi:hypothetical protein
LGCVLDDEQVVAGGEIEEPRDVQRVAEEGHGEDCTGAGGKQALGRMKAEVEGMRVDVSEEGAEPCEANGMGRVGAEHNGQEHLAAGWQIEGAEEDHQGSGGSGCQEGV